MVVAHLSPPFSSHASAAASIVRIVISSIAPSLQRKTPAQSA
jgi:hypothetical protein